MSAAITKELLFEHFAGRTTALQQTGIIDWLQDPNHQQQYIAWLDEWECHTLQYVAEENDAFQRLTNRIIDWEREQSSFEAEPVTPIRTLPTYSRWLTAAAVVLCVLTALYAGRYRLFYRTIQTEFGQTRQVTLPDGSRITLNAHSQLRIPRLGTNAQRRSVWLSGEAAFSIRHTATNQPFVVHTNRQVDVVVLGTDFTVYDRPAGTKVVLSKGAIQLNYTSPARVVRRLRLTPGDAVSVSPAGQLTQSRLLQPELSTTWRDNRFVFKGTSVREIIAILHDTYGVDVILRDQALNDRTITGSFQAKNVDEFLRVVAELLEINYRQSDNRVTFFD